jgi:hypothetical protein
LLILSASTDFADVTFQINPPPELYAFTSATFTSGGATEAAEQIFKVISPLLKEIYLILLLAKAEFKTLAETLLTAEGQVVEEVLYG